MVDSVSLDQSVQESPDSIPPAFLHFVPCCSESRGSWDHCWHCNLEACAVRLSPGYAVRAPEMYKGQANNPGKVRGKLQY